jgi:hypothetical protein
MYHGKDLAAASISRGVAAVADATAESKRLHAIDTREELIEYHQECLEVRRNRLGRFVLIVPVSAVPAAPAGSHHC